MQNGAIKQIAPFFCRRQSSSLAYATCSLFIVRKFILLLYKDSKSHSYVRAYFRHIINNRAYRSDVQFPIQRYCQYISPQTLISWHFYSLCPQKLHSHEFHSILSDSEGIDLWSDKKILTLYISKYKCYERSRLCIYPHQPKFQGGLG